MPGLKLGLGLGVSHQTLFRIITVPVSEPSASDGEASGLDNVTIIHDGGATVTPEIENNGNGKKVTVQTSDYAKIIIAVPPPAPEEDTDYIWRYSTNFAGLTMQGKLAMVGAAVRQGNKYHFAGNRGDGSTGLNAYKIWGNNFSTLKASNEEDGGAVAHGTQAGPNWSKLRVHANGTYTFYNGTGADLASVTWVEEFTGANFTPINDPFSAAEFGIGLYFDKQDKGTAEVDIQLWRATQNQAPTNITLSANTVAEDAAVGTVIGTLTATDPNGGDTHTFSIVADPDSKFQIDGNALEVGAALDYETDTSHSVTIRATDNGNPALYFDKQFTINVTDVSEVNVAVTQFVLRTTTGTQDITIPGFGTPKAARFIAGPALANGTARDNLEASLGATDGTRQYVLAGAAEHNNTSSDTYQRAATDEVIMVLDATDGTIKVEANFDSWITDGVRINVGATTGGAFLVNVVLFGGSDLSAYVNTTALTTQNNSVTLTPNFEANALFVDSHGGSFNDTSAAGAIMSTGVASYDGSTIRQCANLYRSEDNVAAGGTTRGFIRTTGVAEFLSSRYAELASITSTQFNLTARGADLSAFNVGYLAIGLANGAQAWAGVLNAPTATGDADFTSPGFQPAFGFLVPTMIATVDAEQTDGTGSGWGISVFTADDEYCYAWADEDGSDPVDTQSLADSKAINVAAHTGVNAFTATFSSFLSTGVRLNFTAVDSTVRKWPALFIG